MAFNSNIIPGRPPLLWSDVNDAFVKINENFDILVATVGDGSGLTPIDFSSLDTDLSPTTDNLYNIGDITRRWKSVYASEHTVIDPLNGLWAGDAQIKGIGLTVNLPADSTIGGDPITGVGVSLIIDPDKTFFKTAQVDNQESVVANEFADTLNLNSGIAMQLVVDSSAESITFNNTGVTSSIAGLGISVSSATGNVTVTNTGVRSLQNIAALPSGRSTGSGINISGAAGDNIRITNTGVLEVAQGFGITVSTDNATGIATVSFNSGVAPQTAFTRFHIDGDNSVNDIVSDSTADIFNLSQGYGITLTNNPLNDTLTIAVNNRIDIVGSVFGDNSTKIVDAVENKVYADFFGVLTGNVTGNVTGNISGSAGLFTSDVQVGLTGNGRLYAVGTDIYVGNVNAGSKFGLTVREGILQKTILEINPTAKTIALDNTYTVTGFVGNVTGTADIATTVSLVATDSANATHFITFVDTATGNENVRTDTSLTYNPNTNNFSAGNLTGNIFTNLIDSADSSAITVTPLTIFSSDVTVENDLAVTQRFLLRGSRVLNLTELKSIVAESTSFSDFQTRIAALV
jgi:hypothetical protein